MTGRNSSRDQTRSTADGTCQWCGKVSWRDKAAARKLARQRGNGQQAYECQLAPDYAAPPWHVGDPPAQVKTGELPRTEVNSRAAYRLERPRRRRSIDQ